MAQNVTAKVACGSKSPVTDADDNITGASLTFYADYADGRNEAWKLATPTLSVSMTVNANVADLFNQGDKYTLTFTSETAAEEE